MKKHVIRSYNAYHIDNGGISIDIKTEKQEDITSTAIEFDTSYYGYPSIRSIITINQDNIEILECLKDTIIKHLAELKIRDQNKDEDN